MPLTYRHARGMTMTELLVSVTVLLIMIGAFNAILSQSRRVVTTSQATSRANSEATALMRMLRADLTAASQDGFMVIRRHEKGRCSLVFTTAGMYRSVTGTRAANAARIEYGLDDTGAIDYHDNDDADDIENNLNLEECRPGNLFRRVVLLAPTIPESESRDAGNAKADESDLEKVSLGRYQQEWTKDDATPREKLLAALSGSYRVEGVDLPRIGLNYDMVIPPQSLADVRRAWPLLTGECVTFDIEYLDPTASPAEWKQPTASAPTRTFTFDNPSAWPAAIKIHFALGRGSNVKQYSVLCELRE